MGTIERVTVLRTESSNPGTKDWAEAGDFRDVGDACEVAKALARAGSYTKIAVVLHTRKDIRKGADHDSVATVRWVSKAGLDAAQDWVDRNE